MGSERGNRKRNIICLVLCILAAAALGYLYYENQRQEKEQTAALQALRDEVQPYETELQALRTELSQLEEEVSYTSEEAGILVGFVLSAVSDLSYIEEQAKAYDVSPVLILDCTMELEELAEIIAAADGEWEIMLYAPDFSQTAKEAVESVLSYLESIDREQTGIFFLRSDYSSADNIQYLVEDGFIGYTSYNDSPTAGQTEDGLIYFDYSYLTVSGTSVTSRLFSCYNSHATMIVVFDMASVNSGSLSEDYVVSLLDILQGYAQKEDCSFTTVADAVQELSGVNQIEAKNQAAYEIQAAQIRERMEELQEMISAIYDQAEY